MENSQFPHEERCSPSNKIKEEEKRTLKIILVKYLFAWPQESLLRDSGVWVSPQRKIVPNKTKLRFTVKMQFGLIQIASNCLTTDKRNTGYLQQTGPNCD